MTETVLIVLPLPSAELSPNARVNWRVKAAAAWKYRHDCGYAALHAQGMERRKWERVTIQPTFYWPMKRRRDGDNANSSIKNAIDSLQDAGLVVNDSGVRLLPPIFKIDAANRRLELLVTRID